MEFCKPILDLVAAVILVAVAIALNNFSVCIIPQVVVAEVFEKLFVHHSPFHFLVIAQSKAVASKSFHLNFPSLLQL